MKKPRVWNVDNRWGIPARNIFIDCWWPCKHRWHISHISSSVRNHSKCFIATYSHWTMMHGQISNQTWFVIARGPNQTSSRTCLRFDEETFSSFDGDISGWNIQVSSFAQSEFYLLLHSFTAFSDKAAARDMSRMFSLISLFDGVLSLTGIHPLVVFYLFLRRTQNTSSFLASPWYTPLSSRTG